MINVEELIKSGEPNAYCAKDDDTGPSNQNRRYENEIYYSIGKQALPHKESAAYSEADWKNENVIVIIPNYDPPTKKDHNDWHGRLSKNGDIALIRFKKGFRLSLHKASTITLPNPNIAAGNDLLDKRSVRTAGRGQRYYDDTPKEGASDPIHSCYTNGGVIHKRQTPKHVRCLDYKREENGRVLGCPKILNVFDSFSVGSKVDIENCIEGSDKECSASVDLRKNNAGASPLHDECSKLYTEAIHAINRKIAENPDTEDLLSMFKTKTDRFFVYEYDSVPKYDTIRTNVKYHKPNKIPREYSKEVQCYIKNKVAKYGVCKTDQEPYWGFCSKSCRADSLHDSLITDKDSNGFTRYDEVDAWYHEKVPKAPDGSLVKLKWIPKGSY